MGVGLPGFGVADGGGADADEVAEAPPPVAVAPEPAPGLVAAAVAGAVALADGLPAAEEAEACGFPLCWVADGEPEAPRAGAVAVLPALAAPTSGCPASVAPTGADGPSELPAAVTAIAPRPPITSPATESMTTRCRPLGFRRRGAGTLPRPRCGAPAGSSGSPGRGSSSGEAGEYAIGAFWGKKPASPKRPDTAASTGTVGWTGAAEVPHPGQHSAPLR
ncbi:hypothetical protein GCM10023235_11310 [Kitasatospora terrestris]|uniref:Uncharacterized protein n=1 Tax=Kitasatospora terrestris TaxID=258051 RepID=A0ABP9DAV9_9ACTN